jgi:hypothetical protein
VTWLSTAFKTLTLDVTLPGEKFDVSPITTAQGTVVLTMNRLSNPLRSQI